jgi:predicted nuclease with TOPRIM domain
LNSPNGNSVRAYGNSVVVTKGQWQRALVRTGLRPVAGLVMGLMLEERYERAKEFADEIYDDEWPAMNEALAELSEEVHCG